MSTQDLTAKIREIKGLQQLIDEATTEMTAREVDEMDVDVFKIRWKSVTSNRFDTTSFKATHKDLYNQYTKATQSKRFTIA